LVDAAGGRELAHPRVSNQRQFVKPHRAKQGHSHWPLMSLPAKTYVSGTFCKDLSGLCAKKLVDVRGLEPLTPCFQRGRLKTLNGFIGVAYTEINEIPAPQMYRSYIEKLDHAVGLTTSMILATTCDKPSLV
jgi:hypothetical protein